MATNPKLELTQLEADSQLWKRFHEWLAAERAELVERLCGCSLGIADTTVLRGEIRMADRILALADEAGPEARTTDPDEFDGAGSSFFPPQGG